MNISELSDVQSESGVIGTLIRHPDYVEHSDYLQPNQFQNFDNACIYWAIRELYNSGITNIDAYNVSSKLQSYEAIQKNLEKYNLPSIKEMLIMYEFAARDSLEEYTMFAQNVVGFAYKRDLVVTLERIERECEKSDMSLVDLDSWMYSQLGNLTNKYAVTSDVATLGEKIDDIWEEIEKRRNEDGTFGTPSKFPAFNDWFTYEPGEMVTVQARRKQGKSVFLMNEAVHKMKLGIPTLVVDSEMSTRLYTERLLSHLTGIDVKRIKSGQYTVEEEQKLKSSREWIKKQPFIHVYDPNLSMNSLFSMCKMLRKKIGLGFVVYDYLKSNEKSTSDNYNVLGAKADFLKNKIAGELNLPVLAACQLNRGGEIADSEKINMYSSVSIMWRLKNQEMIAADGIQCGNACAKIYLNRLGPQMDESDPDEYIDFQFDGKRMSIAVAPEQHVISDDY